MPAKNLKSIHEAVKLGDVQELQTMVKQGASVNEVDATKDHFTPLHWACYRGALECLHWLLWHGADTTVATPKGWTPVHIAAIRGQDACMQSLANNGANLCAKDQRGSTPAHMAAAHGNAFTLHSLLRSGVEVNAVDKNGWSAVHSAAFHGRLACLQLLIRWGGVTTETDNLGNTPAHLAAMEGQLSCLKFIVSEDPNPTHILSARNNNGETPKMLAQQFFKDKVVEYIVNIEWERDHPEEAENLAFPAHVAAYSGDLNHLRMLIENSIVNINERDEKGSTPAHKAAGQGHLEIIQWLIEMGADMSITNQAGETPRDVARRFARLAVVRALGSGHEDADDAADKPRIPEKVTGEDVDDDIDENDDRDILKLTAAQKKEARGRAKKKLEDLERMLEIAKRNFAQVGGNVTSEQKRLKEERESRREETTLMRAVSELEAQLEYERNRREKLEARLDQYKHEIAALTAQLDGAQPGSDLEDARANAARKKKPIKKRSKSKEDNGVFVRRNVPSGRKQGGLKIV